MNILQNKYINRLTLVITNSLSSIALPAVNVLFSLLVVKISGAELWGEFVYYFLWASLASFILNWGNKDYLLREFSKRPVEIHALWRESFFTRALLLFPLTGIMFLFFFLPETLMLAGWMAVMFIAQSFEVLSVYRRRFILSFAVESVSGLFLLASVYFKSGTGLYMLFIIYLLLRCAGYTIVFSRDIFKNFNIRVRFPILKGSMLFFLLSLTGLLGSRVDQYCVSLFLPKEDLGKYQVLKSFILYFQASAVFIITPFIKNIYRLSDKSIDKINKKIFLTGMVLTPVFIIILYIIMIYVYRFSFNTGVFFYSALIILPVYYYTVIIYKLFNKNKQNIIIYITSVSVIISLVLNLLLLPIYRIEGSLIANIAAGFSASVMYFFVNRLHRL